jgi:hypothetical protein
LPIQACDINLIESPAKGGEALEHGEDVAVGKCSIEEKETLGNAFIGLVGMYEAYASKLFLITTFPIRVVLSLVQANHLQVNSDLILLNRNKKDLARCFNLRLCYGCVTGTE